MSEKEELVRARAPCCGAECQSSEETPCSDDCTVVDEEEDDGDWTWIHYCSKHCPEWYGGKKE